nr:hypothetical protein [Propionispira arboris]
MQKPNITQKDYTTFGRSYQLHLPLNIEFKIPKDDAVRLLRYFVEGMDLSELYRTYSHIEKNQATPRQRLEILKSTVHSWESQQDAFRSTNQAFEISKTF